MKIGYIVKYDLTLNPNLTERFKFREVAFTRRISSRGDRAYSKMLQFPIDYEEIVDNAEIILCLLWASNRLEQGGMTYGIR